jgi:hypothetical protein
VAQFASNMEKIAGSLVIVVTSAAIHSGTYQPRPRG